MTTIQDIAKHAKVSKSTVSRVLNESSVVNTETRLAVEQAITALNYRPNLMAQSLASGRSMTIGIVTQKIGSPFYDSIAQGVIEGLNNTGYSPIFVDGQLHHSTESEVIKALVGRKVDGLVLIGGRTPVTDLEQLKEKLPTILVAREVAGWENRSVCVDNELAGYEATMHLIELGHRAIALIHGIKDQPDAIQRQKGYCRALEKANIVFNPSLIYQADFSAQSGVLAINSLLGSGVYFSAVFAENDMMAMGARLGLSRHGIRVPEDVSIVGFDDQAEVAFMTPPLTTMRQPAVEMGKSAASAVLHAIRDERFEIPNHLIELQRRESVARVR
jgi:LacI family transcriptional regulator